MAVRAIRGAITVDENTKEAILHKTTKLLRKMMQNGDIKSEDIVSVIFSKTRDLDTEYPAVAARNLGLLDVPLMCFDEGYVKGSLEKCIRILMHINTDKTNKEIQHVYIGGAMGLRKDLTKNINIAIDGPAGAGKSTIADLVSKKLSIVHIDTGAMYRAVAYKAIGERCDITSETDMQKIMENIQLKQTYIDGKQSIYLNDEDITNKIRTPEISAGASDVAKLACVRQKLTDIQRDMAKEQSVIMDGRDIGSFVLPDAQLKIFLTASVAERAKRRYKDLVQKGIKNVKIEDVEKDIIARDENDSTRKISPLMKAQDAVLLDSTGLSIEEVVNKIIELVEDI